MSEGIEGIKLLCHNTQGIDHFLSEAERAVYPFELRVQLRQPQFMLIVSLVLFGPIERIVVRGKTVEALRHFLVLNDIPFSLRLIKWEIVEDLNGRTYTREIGPTRGERVINVDIEARLPRG